MTVAVLDRQRPPHERAWHALPREVEGADHPGGPGTGAGEAVEPASSPAVAGRPLLTPPTLADLQQLQCPQQQQQLLCQWLGELGFDGLGVARAVRTQGLLRPRFGALSPFCSEWSVHYEQQQLSCIDPCMSTLASSALPCLWDAEGLAETALHAHGPAACGRWRIALAVHGVRSGLWFRLHLGPAAQTTLVAMTSRRSGRAWISEGVIGRAWMLAVFAAEHRSTACDCAGRLSATQRQILQCVEQGMSDKQIARLLNMSTHNVDYHLRRLRQQYGVSNRLQLVRSALGPCT